MTSAESDWLTVAEACTYLRITRATLYRWAREGRVRLYKFSKRATRAKRSELERMLTTDDEPDSWTALSEPAFAKDWDNDKDAEYDNWREIYGTRKR